MATKFVQAAGGCGAMNAKDPDQENVGLGKMLVKTFPPALSTAPLFEGQVMLKHPNSNGMQLDIDSGGYIPARFVKEMTVKRGNDLVFHMASTFSISTNPNFRFTFGRGATTSLTSPWSIPTARCSRRSRSQAGRNLPTRRSNLRSVRDQDACCIGANADTAIGERPPSRLSRLGDAKKPPEPGGRTA